ncbi:hypothetical protein MASR2M78_15460 [Treponema sp.]
MTHVPSGAAQYLARFADQNVACSQYALAKLGVNRSHCFLKIDEYQILCAPFQFGFKRSLLIASLSKEELVFFQRYINGIVGLSLEFTSPHRKEPIKLFIRCSLAAAGQMKGRDRVGLLVVDFKTTPEDYINILGSYLEGMERLQAQYNDYGKTEVRVNAEAAKSLGYNQFATAADPAGAKRIQVFSLSSQHIEHLEGGAGSERAIGTSLGYQLFFRKYRVGVAGEVETVERLPNGLIKTRAKLAFSPELVEIMDDYWFRSRLSSRA